MTHLHIEQPVLREATIVERGRNDRTLFEMWLRNQEQERKNLQALHDAKTFDDIILAVGPDYEWLTALGDEAKANYVTAVTFIREFQSATFQEHGEFPTGRQTYVHFRRSIETDGPVAPHETAAVHLIEALMGGDLKNGEVPILAHSSSN